MSELEFASNMLKQRIAPPGSAGGKMERIRDAARSLKWKFSRASSVWYADARASIKPSELRAVEEKTGVKYEEYAKLKKHEDLEEVDDLIERAQALLDSKHPRVRRALFAAMRTFARRLASPGIGRER